MTRYLADADSDYSMKVSARQTQSDWQGPKGTITTQVDGVESYINYSAHTTGEDYTVKITSAGSITID